MGQLELTSTVVPRPDIWRISYPSFLSHLRGVEISRLIVNLDPVPGRQGKQADLDTILPGVPRSSRIAEVGNFAEALKWVWSQAESEYIVHIEDDWELLEDIDAAGLIGKMGGRAQIVFRSFNRDYESMANRYRFHLSPCVIRRSCYKWIAENMPTDRNPEQWIRRQNRFQVACYPPERDRIIVRDLGEAWRKGAGLCKGGGGEEGFTGYEEGDNDWFTNQAAQK